MKKLKYLAVLALAALMAPILVMATPSPKIDSSNLFMVKNQTLGGNWGTSATASPGETIAYNVHLHNSVIDSVETNVSAKVTLPTGFVTSYTSTATVSATNASSVSATTSVTLTKSAKVTYVPGSTKLYNHSAQLEANLPDGITEGGITVLTSQKGCWDYEKWVRFEVKVEAPVVTPTPTPTPNPTPTPTENPTPTPEVVVEEGKGNNLPESGPVEAAAGAVGLTSVGGAAFAWLRSKKALLDAITKIK